MASYHVAAEFRLREEFSKLYMTYPTVSKRQARALVNILSNLSQEFGMTSNADLLECAESMDCGGCSSPNLLRLDMLQ